MESSEALAAVVVPVYNQDRAYLSECVESVMAQTWQSWRLIIVDDGSDSETAAHLESLAKADHRITLVHQENAGPSAARNRGIELAKGAEYLAFLDADDLLEPKMLERCIGQMNEAGADIAACTHSLLIDGKKQPGDYRGPDRILFEKEDLTEYQRLCFCSTGMRGVRFPFCVCVWGKVFRMSLLLENEDIRFNPDLIYSDDQFFVQRLVPRAERLLLMDEELYSYRTTATSIVRGLREDLIEGNMKAFDVLKEALDLSDRRLAEAFDNYRAGYLVVYGTTYLYHPQSRLSYLKRRRLLKEAAGLPHFRETIDKIRPEFFTKGQYFYLKCIRYRLYGPALLAVWFGARRKWKGN